MQTHAEKQSPPRTDSKKSGKSTSQFNNRRPEAVAQKKLQEMADSYTQNKYKQPIQLMNGTYSHQPLISNYFAHNPTNQNFSNTNLPYHFSKEDIEVEGGGNDFTATVAGIGLVGTLTLLNDYANTKWINNIDVNIKAQRKGVGTALLQAAIEEHGVIYASTQEDYEDDGEDTRHLEPEGRALVQSCIGRGMNIIYTHPTKITSHHE
ncbi:GNAT family N-acetyltransferase [Paludibacterium purpuratum]|uniref:Acetyltransferase (GNAT) family protein n=1 Tax=Paludibacterium purpuratum TaxID=1144873 RepID=A0A4R7BAF1_9NEIS|nr:GNAT family N-acetyltransferase [Paludibacterium purpuratum]TDR81920.1 acetyltransferase (GNAT) family protein [Paludibacterium purpuratum]